MPITLRPVIADDEEFLFTLYCSTRSDELAGWGWDAAQQKVFLRMQFFAQQHQYHVHLPSADNSIVLRDEQPIGRMIVIRARTAVRLVDIALLPEHRNLGIGATLIKGVLAEAEQAGKPVRLQVVKHNRARRLYERLGFAVIADGSTHLLMERGVVPRD